MRRNVWCVQLLAAVLLTAGRNSCGCEGPPFVPSPKPFHLPAPVVRELSNHLKVVVVERQALPIVSLRLVIETGAEADPIELPGAAQLVASLLNEGTARRSALEIAEAVDSAGGTIVTGAEWDYSFAALSVLSDHSEQAFDLLADIVCHPAFAPEEIERIRKQTLSSLEVLRDDPAYVADAVFDRLVFEGTPYGHPADGTLEAIRRAKAEDLRRFYSRYYRPGNAILAIVGAISPSEAIREAEKYFGNWPEGDGPMSAPLGSHPEIASQRIVVIDKSDAVETEVRVGNTGIPRAGSEYFSLTVANQILGGPASDRLFRTLRTERGLTYSASSDLICNRSAGSWKAKTFTRTSETVKSLEYVMDEMHRLRDRPISDAELATARGYLAGHLTLEFETAAGIASHLLDLIVQGLPLDYWNTFPENLQKLTPDEVLAATRRYLAPERAVIVLVGNAAGFSKDLAKLGPVRIIPFQSLDFASPNLERSSLAAH